jgi:hypothetical protein
MKKLSKRDLEIIADRKKKRGGKSVRETLSETTPDFTSKNKTVKKAKARKKQTKVKKPKNEIEVTYHTTPSGKHLIDMGEKYGRLVFADMTKHRSLGYKHITYSRAYMDVVVMKTGDRRRTFEVPTRDSYVFNLKFKRDEEGKKGVPRGTIPQKVTNFLATIFEKLTVDGYLPDRNLPKLKKIIEKTDFNKLKVKKSKPKKRKKKVIEKPTPQQVEQTNEAFDILRRSLNGENGS